MKKNKQKIIISIFVIMFFLLPQNIKAYIFETSLKNISIGGNNLKLENQDESLILGQIKSDSNKGNFLLFQTFNPSNNNYRTKFKIDSYGNISTSGNITIDAIYYGKGVYANKDIISSDKICNYLGCIGDRFDLWNGYNEIYYFDGNVGVGLSEPKEKLHINGSLSNNVVWIGKNSQNHAIFMHSALYPDKSKYSFYQDQKGTSYIGNNKNHLYFRINNQDKIIINRDKMNIKNNVVMNGFLELNNDSFILKRNNKEVEIRSNRYGDLQIKNKGKWKNVCLDGEKFCPERKRNCNDKEKPYFPKQ